MFWLLVLWLIPPILVFSFGIYCIKSKLKLSEDKLVSPSDVASSTLLHLIPVYGIFSIIGFILSIIIQLLIRCIVKP